MKAGAYSGVPTRNPLRFLRALWRAVKDPSDTDSVAVVQIGFSRSRLGRRFARWEKLAVALRGDPRTTAAVTRRAPPIDLEALHRLPPGSFGRAFAEHCRSRGLDPNLVAVAGDADEDRLIHNLYTTHDIWHVVTGWGNDETGEVGLGGFYVAQLDAPFFPFLLALVLLNTAFVAPGTLRERMDALTAGYRAGRQAEPLIAVDWDALWELPLPAVQARLGLADAEGHRAA